jgi:hypothetical protein
VTSTCITSLDLCAIRAAALSATGVPLAGATYGYTSAAPIRLQVGVQTEAGAAGTLRNGCGLLMLVYRNPDQVTGVELSLDLCQLDADLLSLMTGARLYNDGAGNAVGLQAPQVGAQPGPVSFECWTKAWNLNQQYVHTQTAPNPTWIHWVFPFTRWTPGDVTLEHDLLTIPVKGTGAENPVMPTAGPFNDWPIVVGSAGGATGVYAFFLDSAPPPATCTWVATNAPVVHSLDGNTPSDNTIVATVDGNTPSDSTVLVIVDGGSP